VGVGDKMLELEEMNYTQCYNCDAEFKVQSLFDNENEQAVSFCPFCGEELDSMNEEELWEDIEEE